MSNKSITFLGLSNIVSRDYCTILPINSAFEPADMPGELMKTEEPSEVARLSTLNPQSTVWKFSTYFLLHRIDGFSLVNTSLSSTGKWRFVGSSEDYETDSLSAFDPPTSILASSNITGSVGNIQESLDNPGSGFIEPTDPTIPWSVRLAVPATQPIRPGPDRTALVLWVKAFDNTGSPLDNVISYPRLDAELWESGVKKLEMGHKAVTNLDGQYIIFPFDSTLLTSPTNGSNLQFLISGTMGRNNLGSSQLYFKLGIAALMYDTDDYELDTGWLSNYAAPWGFESDGPQPTVTVHKFIDTAWAAASSFTLLFMDDQTVHNPMDQGVSTTTTYPGVVAGLIPRLPDTFIDVGVVCVGETLSLTYGIQSFASFAPQSQSTSGVTSAGQSYAADAFRRRVGEPLDLLITREEGLALLDRIGWRKGASGAFFVALEPGVASDYQLFSSAWVTCSEISGMAAVPGVYSKANKMMYTIRIKFEEKL